MSINIRHTFKWRIWCDQLFVTNGFVDRKITINITCCQLTQLKIWNQGMTPLELFLIVHTFWKVVTAKNQPLNCKMRRTKRYIYFLRKHINQKLYTLIYINQKLHFGYFFNKTNTQGLNSTQIFEISKSSHIYKYEKLKVFIETHTVILMTQFLHFEWNIYS